MVSFHGSLTAVKPAQPGSIKAKILVLTGGDDGFVPPEQVEAFKSEMKAAGADFQVISYPGRSRLYQSRRRCSGKKVQHADRLQWGRRSEILERHGNISGDRLQEMGGILPFRPYGNLSGSLPGGLRFGGSDAEGS